MKKIIYLLIVFAGISCTQAKNNTNNQAEATVDKTKIDTNSYIGKPAQANPNISYLPAYQITTVDSVKLTHLDLKKNKPVMLIYFSPDCDHCQHFIKALKPKLKAFSKFQILLITWHKLQTLRPFYKAYGLAAYPNIILATEGNENMMIQQYFQVKDTPFTALYNSQGKLVWYYEKAPKIDHLVAQAKKL